MKEYALKEQTFDLAVIGGGPGGYVACIRAAQLGLKTVCIEREHLGGICLNWGCIPTKALLRSSEMFYHINHLKGFGLKADNPGFDLQAIVKRSRAVAGKLNTGVKHLLKKNKIAVIDGEAELLAKGRVRVTDKKGMSEEIAAKDIILATGARPRELPHLKADGLSVWNYKHAMTAEALPESILVIGAGAIGMEFASFYSDLGAKVTVVEMLDRILPAEDRDISTLAGEVFTRQGIRIMTSASVTEPKPTSNNVKVTIKQGENASLMTVDKVILAVGITGNIENIGLEELKVKTGEGRIDTDQWGHTSVAGLWAIGDVTGGPWLAHKASHEAVAAVEKIAGFKGVPPLDKDNIPACIYCRPQVASVGLTEQAAKERGHKIRTGKFPFMANGKAIVSGETDGFVKTIFDEETGELLGAHMLGAEVTEMIQGYAVARTLETTETELMHTVFPHPTLSESMHESVLDAYGKVTHL